MYLNRNNWVEDISLMHEKYKAKAWVFNKVCEEDYKTLDTFLAHRIDFLEEEVTETVNAYGDGDATDVVDGLIDTIVVALGTLDLFGVDSAKVWDEVYHSNMNKEVGIKESRPNPLGVPDLIKPKGWEPPRITMKDCGILPAVLTYGRGSGKD